MSKITTKVSKDSKETYKLSEAAEYRLNELRGKYKIARDNGDRTRIQQIKYMAADIKNGSEIYVYNY